MALPGMAPAAAWPLTSAHSSSSSASPSSLAQREAATDWVLAAFHECSHANPDMAVAVAAIRALTAVIRRSQASTMMELELELRDACTTLKARHVGSISVHAACDLFLCFVTRSSSTMAMPVQAAAAAGLDVAGAADVHMAKKHLIERGERFGDISLKARQTIAQLGQAFVRGGSVVLVHGFSRVVCALLKAAAQRGTDFTVVATEGRVDGSGARVAAELSAAGVPVTVVVDCAVGRVMRRCAMLLLGAEGVVESGGIVNTLGTFQAAVIASAMGKPVYVAAESYKFARMFPLEQFDLGPDGLTPTTASLSQPPGAPPPAAAAAAASVAQFDRDYTPPELITLLFTDLGVLTPAAVSDELIQLYL